MFEREVEALKDAYRIWNDSKGGDNRFVPMMADDVRWFSLADGADPMDFTRPGNGRDHVEAYFAGVARDWAMNHFVAEDFVVDEAAETVVVRSHMSWTNRHNGKTMATPKLDLIRFRDGRIVEVREFYDTAAVIAAAT